MTRDALSRNKEWNVCISSRDPECGLLTQTLDEFEKMWNDSEVLTEEWIKNYEPSHIRAKIENTRKVFEEGYADVIKPNLMQGEALVNLAAFRNQGRNRALLVSATGTGKTYLSAFDVKNAGVKKLLFLVHREQILNDAMDSYRNVHGSAKIGMRTLFSLQLNLCQRKKTWSVFLQITLTISSVMRRIIRFLRIINV